LYIGYLYLFIFKSKNIMAELISFILESFFVVFIFMNLFFILSLIFKRNDIADSAWGLGFIVTAFYHLLKSGVFLQTKIIVFTLIVFWGLRLVTYISLRNRNKAEDFRYKEWRDKWGKSVLIKSYFQVFLLQGLFMILVSLPATLYLRFGGNIVNLSFLCLLVWVVGFYFETLGDWQMYLFKKNPKNRGKILTSGLWKYTRHPNYFGEVSIWWGIWIMTIGSEYWYLGSLGPITITILILFVSGIPMLEKKYKHDREFQEYKKKTSVFFPLPARSVKVKMS